MGIPLVPAGVQDADTSRSPSAVIDQALARRFWPGASPLGALGLDWSPPGREVVAWWQRETGDVQGEDWAHL